MKLPPLPDRRGFFGPYGGAFVPETLVAPLRELDLVYRDARRDPAFRKELGALLRDFVGRPTPLLRAERLGEALGGVRVHLKREDLAHTGAHKINNTVGQALLTRRMGKRRVIAETGAGQHGVAAATAAARFGLECVVYMGEVDMARQSLNVRRMELLGAKVVPVSSGSRTLKDAINEALRDWVTNVRDTHYILGSALGPHPFPMMVRDFHEVIGKEARAQFLRAEKTLPDLLVACVGGGSNAIGLFHAMLRDPVRMVGVEAGGIPGDPRRHAARLRERTPGVLHGTHTYVLQDEEGQIRETHSVSAGLDYPAIGPEHSLLHDLGRVEYDSIPDGAALAAMGLLASTEGILCALECAHAIAWLWKEQMSLQGKSVIVSLSGRGDKDVDIAGLAAPG